MCMGGRGFALSTCLGSCGIGVWLGMAAQMRHTSLCLFCCISCNVAFGGRSVTHLWPWNHVPPYVWTDKSNSAATQDEGEDEVAPLFALQLR